MSSGTVMRLDRAKTVADHLVELLAPYCQRIEIGGSVRRRQMSVRDIELVVIPKSEKDMTSCLFEEEAPEVNLLLSYLNGLVEVGAMTRRLDSMSRQTWGLKHQAAMFGEVSVDIFQVTPETWGVQFALRTGPAPFSKALVTPRRFNGLLPDDMYVRDGRLWQHGVPDPIVTNEEIDFFNAIGFKNGLPDPEFRSSLIPSERVS